MNLRSLALAAVAGLAFQSATAIAGEKDDAVKLVNEAAVAVEKNRSGAVNEINQQNGKYTKGAVYVFAYEMDGTMAAHPINPKLIGKQLLDVPDAEGKMFRKEILEGVNSAGTATVAYKYKNPKSGVIEDKVTYCKKAATLAVCAGYYN